MHFGTEITPEGVVVSFDDTDGLGEVDVGHNAAGSD